MNNKGSYNPTEWEQDIYKLWQDANAFRADENSDKPSFCIIMPPPNVTGQAHMGHAIDDTLQDVLVRYKRMQGYNCLWQPGTDHAALATEAKIVEKLTAEGKTKEQIGRAQFDKLAWDWYNNFGDRIVRQFKRMGFSADWSRYRFTMDDTSTKAVLTAFVNLFNKGLIYRGSRQTNWCVHCKSVISDDEVEYKEENGSMWHIRYPFADGSGHIVVATTRPETLFGDTAVAVNPEDKRYKNMVGKMLKLPLTDRQIPIIADSYVDQAFGTGMVKITPAHDPNDYQVGKRHNLKLINVISKDGKLTDAAGQYQGLTLVEGRQAVIKALQEQNLLEKIEPHIHNVGHCERCHTAVEPMVTEQWFVAMKELVKPAIQVVKDGRLQIHPKRFEKNYLHWLENIQDWCISRQIWTGHQIPIYYCQDCGNTVADMCKPGSCPKCGGHNFVQDQDVLDTWFSSSLWPFSTLGWPEATKELKKFYPTDCLVTAYDILTHWVTKMVYMGMECMGDVPFRHVLIHGLIRDSQGRKMSKSLGNGIDPLAEAEKYGADALRIAIIKDMALGIDTRYSDTKIETSRAFINKLWNASKFIAMHSQGEQIVQPQSASLSDADKWVMHKLCKLIENVNANFDAKEVGVALTNIYNFVLEDFCDWYIELVKPAIYAGGQAKSAAVSTLNFVLDAILKLLHPYIPFVTEYIYQNSKQLNPNGELLINQMQVKPFDVDQYNISYQNTEKLIATIAQLRALKVEAGISANKKPIVFAPASVKGLEDVINKLAAVTISFEQGEGRLIATGLGNFSLQEEKVDTAELVKTLSAQITKLQSEIKRSSGMLSSSGFVAKAPQALIQAEKDKLAVNTATLAELQAKLDAISGK